MFVCVSVCLWCVQVPLETRNRSQALEFVSTQVWALELNLHPLEEQQVRLTSELLLQFCLLVCVWIWKAVSFHKNIFVIFSLIGLLFMLLLLLLGLLFLLF